MQKNTRKMNKQLYILYSKILIIEITNMKYYE